MNALTFACRVAKETLFESPTLAKAAVTVPGRGSSLIGGTLKSDAACNKCELNLAHTIIAMVGPKVVKVECNTCHTVHAYKGVQPLVAGKVKKAGPPRLKRARR